MKTYVIALTTYREIVRRPLIWLLFLVAAALLFLFDLIPYYTMGEDIKMVKDQGLTVIKVIGLIVALMAASVSISEEIDGRTAITLLSKPINRRQFIVGKYGGIVAAIGLLFVLLGIVFLTALVAKAYYDAHEDIIDPPTFTTSVELMWSMVPGIVLTYFEVMVLSALSVAFSTRMPLFLNVLACFSIFLFGHLAPQMVQASAHNQFEGVQFMARFFATILPGLEYFNVGPAISTETAVPWFAYVLPCFLYTIIYTTISLLFAFILFEDRDMA